MTKLLPLLAVVALAACGGTKPDKGTGPNGTGSGDGTGAATGSGSAVPTAKNPITLEQCDAMMAHIIDVGVSEMPVDKRPTPDKVAELKARPLSDSDKEQCLAFPKPTYDCIMAATTGAAIESCEPA
jgi:hypothetical protein